MATFIGSKSEFRRYIGPRLRNLVQMFAASHRANIGKCAHCEATEKLQAAHVQGRDRNQIIDAVLGLHGDGTLFNVDLHMFESSFIELHQPLEESFVILCASCHKTYDSRPKGRIEKSSEAVLGEALPIFLNPTDPAEFKKALLASKSAEIIVLYIDGREERKVWNPANMSPASNVIGNLLSRPEFRAGKWQQKGICSIKVRVKNA